MQITPETRKKMQEELDKIEKILLDYEEFGESWVITNYINRNGIKKSKIEPITVNRFLEPLLQNKIIIKMSATLSPEPDSLYLETASPFPVEIRHWEWKPLGRFSKDYRDLNIPRLAEYLTTLKGKSLVHCQSYENANKIAFALRTLGVYPLKQTNNDDDEDEDVVRRWEVVEAFKKSKKPNEILLSVKLDRGVDFWEPEIQNNIIGFIPFPNPSEPLTKAKNNTVGLSWQDKYVAHTVMQAHGRIHRGIFNYNDVIKERPDLIWLPHTKEGYIIKKTIITDANWNNLELGFWYDRNRRHFNLWFQEAELKYNKVMHEVCEKQNMMKKEVNVYFSQ